MSDRQRDLSLPVAVALAAASGVLAWFADYPRPVIALAWVAPAPLLVAVLRRPSRDVVVLGALFAALSTAAIWRTHDPIFQPIQAMLGQGSGLVVQRTAFLAAAMYLARRVPAAGIAWAFAAVMAVAEWLVDVGPFGLWYSLSAPLAGSEAARAIARIGGPPLVAFAASLVAGTLALPFVVSRAAALGGFASAAAVAGVLLAVGGSSTPGATTVRVGAVVHRPPADVAARWDRHDVRSDDTWTVVAAYEVLTKRAAADGARVVVWPEYAVFVLDADRRSWQARLAALSRETGAVIVAGFIDADLALNQALLVTPDGSERLYTKQHLILVVESSWLHSGTDAFLATRYGDLAVAVQICYDLDFTSGARAAARGGVDLLAAPARDWRGIEERHAMQGVFRAAENGLPMVRATRDGWSLIVDPSGRIVARASNFETPDVVLVHEVPLAAASTPYRRAGNWVPAAAVVVCGLMVLAGRSRRARASTAAYLPQRPAR